MHFIGKGMVWRMNVKITKPINQVTVSGKSRKIVIWTGNHAIEYSNIPYKVVMQVVHVLGDVEPCRLDTSEL